MRNSEYKTLMLAGILFLLGNQMFSQTKITTKEAETRNITPSKIYAQYAKVPNMIVMEVQNLKIDSLHKITITLLVTEDPETSEQLKVDFKLGDFSFNDTSFNSGIVKKTFYRNKENIAEAPILNEGKVDLSKSCIVMPVKFPHQLRVMIISGNFNINTRITIYFLIQKIKEAITLAKKNNDNITIIQN